MGLESIEWGSGHISNGYPSGQPPPPPTLSYAGIRSFVWLAGARCSWLMTDDCQFATCIWFFSLRQLQELCDIWERQPSGIQQAIQDRVSLPPSHIPPPFCLSAIPLLLSGTTMYGVSRDAELME